MNPKNFEFMGGNEYFGVSRPHMDESVARALEKLPPIRTVLDLGSGRGKIGILAKGLFPKAKITGVDINPDSQRWINGFLPDTYQEIHTSNLPTFLASYPNKVELVTAGDVLEHLTEKEFAEIVENIKRIASYLLIVSPIQLEEDLHDDHNSQNRTGAEKHQIVLDPEKIKDLFPKAEVLAIEKRFTANFKGENRYEKFMMLLKL